MNMIIGLVVIFGCVFGGYMVVGGYFGVFVQLYELFEIVGVVVGGFIIVNLMKVIKDMGKVFGEVFGNKVFKEWYYFDMLGVFYVLMCDLCIKLCNEIEVYIDNLEEFLIFQVVLIVFVNYEFIVFICDYVCFIIIGNV